MLAAVGVQHLEWTVIWKGCAPLLSGHFKKINGVLKTFEGALLKKNIITHKVTVEANIVA